MAVESGATKLGTPLPELELPDVDGNLRYLPELRAEGVLVVVFACNHCPYVRHVETRLGEMAEAFDDGVQFVAIQSNDVQAYPDDDVAGMREQALRANWTFPYLKDFDQVAARTFGAVCTPDFFVFGVDGTLTYRGAFDASSPKNQEPLTGDLLRNAIELTLAQQPVPTPQRPAMGCGLKWLTGNEPEAVTFS